jgi:hypothetical protein
MNTKKPSRSENQDFLAKVLDDIDVEFSEERKQERDRVKRIRDARGKGKDKDLPMD